MTEHRLLSATSPATILPGEASTDVIRISGFASVESADRHGDRVDPREFRISQFMTSPTLLVNHAFWNDANGNKVSVGTVTSMNAVSVRASADPLMWDLFDLDTENFVSSFPKSSSPNLVAGSRGLFVRADVTQPDIVGKVARGELSAFSWRGMAHISPLNEEGTQRSLYDIDLWEVSLVNIPANQDATFVIGKSVYAVRFPKKRFSVGAAKEYVKRLFTTSELTEDSDGYSCIVGSSREIDISQLETLGTPLGANIVAGPSLLRHDDRASLQKDTSMPELTSSDTPSISADTAAPLETPATVDKNLDALTSHIVEKTVAGLTAHFTALSEALAGFTTTVTKTLAAIEERLAASKSSADTPVDTPVDTPAEEASGSGNVGVLEAVKQLALLVQAQQNQIASVTKGMQSIAQAPLRGVSRPESVVVPSKTDPNAVFDRVFSFLS